MIYTSIKAIEICEIIPNMYNYPIIFNKYISFDNHTISQTSMFFIFETDA